MHASEVQPKPWLFLFQEDLEVRYWKKFRYVGCFFSLEVFDWRDFSSWSVNGLVQIANILGSPFVQSRFRKCIIHIVGQQDVFGSSFIIVCPY